ncbi:MAG: ABC transporter ATP-binding protein [Gemmatimonadales bacterium]
MSGVAIRAEGLTKTFALGQLQPTLSLKSAMTEAVTTRLRSASAAVTRTLSGDRSPSSSENLVHALRGVSMEVGRGEVLGIIGRNGAGKSTLLRILTRITPPTAGWAEIHGRVGALIGVGTGFHPDLSGRENVYMNGAILGMKRTEIERRFDEIVSFAEVERFLDTPVKRYSSGMYMRLAFAVAAHMEPDILLVDEVLAVGDAAFQRKCLGKMEGIARESRAILFVSHNMSAVQTLCHRVIWLDDGRIVASGNPREVIGEYLKKALVPLTERTWDEPSDAPGTAGVRLRRVCIRPSDGSPDDRITLETPFLIEIEYWIMKADARFNLSLNFLNGDNVLIFKTAPATEPETAKPPMPAGLFRDVCKVPAHLLNTGVHRIELVAARDHVNVEFSKEDIVVFEVLESETPRPWQGNWRGAVRPALEWSTEQVTDQRVS